MTGQDWQVKIDMSRLTCQEWTLIKTDWQGVICQEWHIKNDLSRATGQEWHVKSNISGMRNQEEQLIRLKILVTVHQLLIKSDMKLQKTFIKYLSFDNVVLSQPKFENMFCLKF